MIGHFYPYGQEKPSATTNGTEKFTGYLRDGETGMDYADQRYHVPGTGRFLTADPYMNSAGPTDPGSWNRYAYSQGDPITLKDPTGLDDCDADGCDKTCYWDDSCETGGDSGYLSIGAEPLPPDQVYINDSATLIAAGFFGSTAITDTGNPATDVFQTTLSPSQFLELTELGFLQANPATLDEIVNLGQVIITVGTATIGALVAWFESNSKATWSTGSTPTPDEVIAKCQPVGPPVVVPSTKRGNRSGGQSIEQEYKCPDGSTWTIHTVVDANGKIVLDPHVRGGGPRYGMGGRRIN